MTLDVTTDPAGGRDGEARSGPGPLWLLVPLLIAALAALSWDDLFGPRTGPARADMAASGGVSAFAAEAVPGWHRIQLVPFHPHPRRQAFEAAALRRTRDLDEGEPWRLLLVRSADTADFELGQVTISDSDGVALRPLEHRVDAHGEHDPLGVLLQPWTGPIAPEAERQVLLWGRRPRGTVRLSGIGGRDGDPESSILLDPRELQPAELPRHLARLEVASKPPEGSADPTGE